MKLETVKVKDLFEIRKGKKVDQVSHSSDEKVFRYIQIEDLRDETNIKYAFDNGKSVFSTKEDVIIAWDGANAGTVGYGLEGIIGSTLAVLKPKTNSFYVPYVGEFLKTKSGFLRANCTGATIPHIQKKVLEDIKIPFPPIENQKSIIKMVDQARKLIQKRKQAIEKLDELVQSVFLEMFGDPLANVRGWEVKKLKDCCIQITDGTHHSPPSQSEGIPYITAKHISENVVDFHSDPTYVSLDDHEKIYKRCPPKKGDVLYIKDGVTSGTAAINPYDFEFSMLSSLALIKVDHEKLLAEYLTCYLNMVKRSLMKNMSGAAIKRFTLSKIKEFEIPIPEKKLQERHTDIYVQIQKIQKEMQQSLVLLESNFQSLLQKAFKGELTKPEKIEA